MKKAFLLVCPAMMMFSSCATIVSGGSPTITLDGHTREPVTVITEKATYTDVTFPVQVKVNRHHIQGQRIHIKSENYDYKDIILNKAINSMTFGNILLGGLIGWSVDLITNCVSEPDCKQYYVEPQPKPDTSRSDKDM